MSHKAEQGNKGDCLPCNLSANFSINMLLPSGTRYTTHNSKHRRQRVIHYNSINTRRIFNELLSTLF